MVREEVIRKRLVVLCNEVLGHYGNAFFPLDDAAFDGEDDAVVEHWGIRLSMLSSPDADALRTLVETLHRLDGGTYGVCDGCGGPIGDARLIASPTTRYCVTCESDQAWRPFPS
jgi:hypothetical protein